MPTLRKNNFGYWFLEARVDGQRIRKTLKTKDRKIAEARGNLFLRDLNGESHSVSRVTLDDFKQEYLEYAKGRKAPVTVEGETIALRRFAEICPEAQRLDQITHRTADSFVTRISKEGNKPAGINFYIRTLRSIFSVAVNWKYLQANPFAQVKTIRTEAQLPRILTLKEITAFFKKAAEISAEYVPLYEFYLLTGMRRSEALRLEWKDVDLDRGMIILRNTKSKRPRFVKMSPRVKTILSSRKQLPRPFDYDMHWVSQNFSRIAKEAKIKDISIHDLRRSFASYAADSGMPTLFIPWILGHQSIQVTQDHYAGMTDKMMSRYLANLEKKVLPN